MPKRKSAASSGTADDGYRVGYGKPPLHSRFRAGQSGNPVGRRKGLRNLATDVVRTLSAPINVTEGGRKRTRSTQQAMLLVLREKALKGDARAIDLLVKLAQQCNNATEGEPSRPLDADDQVILDAYVAKRSGAVAWPQSSNDTAPKSDAHSDEEAPE
jgi:Family of unknown function (DUF5681)